LCDSVLTYDSLQRSEKLDDFAERDIEDEFADVIITALLLADTIDVDIEVALENKIEVIEERQE
jgi:NTP pyrophosphatase (non-canonical NTP hydrolase)